MPPNAQLQAEQPFAFAYERTFLRTVLCLRGVEDAATEQEIEEARIALRHYELSRAMAPAPHTARPNDSLKGRMPEPAAVEHAFMFVRFHSVLPPNAGQLKALNDWLSSHKLP